MLQFGNQLKKEATSKEEKQVIGEIFLFYIQKLKRLPKLPRNQERSRMILVNSGIVFVDGLEDVEEGE